MNIEGHELILIIAIPFFVLSIVFEYLILKRQHREKEIYNLTDTAGSLLMGIGLLVFITAAKYSSFLIYFYVYENFRLFELGHEWWVWTLAFFAEDFSTNENQ